ncbi:MAG TPA: hypothetical protein VGL74_01665 [Terriglobales bacterium]
MSRMLDLIRASALPAHQMMSASKGALRLPEVETLEILVYIAEHNKIFGEAARLTLAGWDEASSQRAAADPKAPLGILEYWLSPKNIRPALFPILIENPTVSITRLSELAATLKNEMIDVMIASPRVRDLPQVLQDLSTNHYLTGTQAARVKALIAGKVFVDEANDQPASEVVACVVPDAPSQVAHQDPDDVLSSVQIQAEPVSVKPAALREENNNVLADDPEAEVALKTFLTEHAKEIESQPEKPFHAIGGLHEDILDVEEPKAMAAATAGVSTSATPLSAPAQPRVSHKPPVKPDDGKRDSVLQKISKLDIKGRIQLAMKGTKEERAILVRDGTKIIALAVLDSPKITDGEVEKFAGQKNVLEAVLRAIPMKRRFAKNYAVVRALVFNPRTPLDVSLGLIKNLLVADLKNLSGNKEVAETVRKLALRMFRQKNEAANKK